MTTNKFARLLEKELTPIQEGMADFAIKYSGYEPSNLEDFRKAVQLTLLMNSAFQRSSENKAIHAEIKASKKTSEKRIAEEEKAKEEVEEAEAKVQPKKRAAKKVTTAAKKATTAPKTRSRKPKEV